MIVSPLCWEKIAVDPVGFISTPGFDMGSQELIVVHGGDLRGLLKRYASAIGTAGAFYCQANHEPKCRISLVYRHAFKPSE